MMTTPPKQKIFIAVVGDIHDQWEEADNLALQALGVDLVLFVGDFGNESVSVVHCLTQLPIPIAAIAGNHDAWYSASTWGHKQCPYDRTQEDRVQQQLDLLGEAHVGYAQRDFSQFNLSVVGARPFSWGGPEWKNKEFLRDRYNVTNFTESTAKIVASAQRSACDTLIFLGHNGPAGLGEQPEDICGRDWQPLGGDHGDPDLSEAIAQVRVAGKLIPLVTFGHMHHRLRHTQSRLRTPVKVDALGTVYLNAASVPRIRQHDGQTQRNFCLVSLKNSIVEEISLIWVGHDGAIVSQECLFSMNTNVVSERSHNEQ